MDVLDMKLLKLGSRDGLHGPAAPSLLYKEQQTPGVSPMILAKTIIEK